MFSIKEEQDSFLTGAYSRLRSAVQANESSTLPPLPTIRTAESTLPSASQPEYLKPLGPNGAIDHILSDILPALNGQALGSCYFGFVTGGTHPVAEAADNVVSALDQNVQVHLPDQTICTAVEDAALRMLLSLLRLEEKEWPGRTFTSGATVSNIMGLACGREAVLQRRLHERAGEGEKAPTPAELGLLAAAEQAGVNSIQILTSVAHSSLVKAASIVGLGHASVRELPRSADEPWRLDVDAVERELKREGVANIIAISAGEVNTGGFATAVLDMPKLRSLADKYGAWIHVDGAFGIFARSLPDTDEFLELRAITAGLELADSITADGHKLLNVPYDNGIFLCRDLSIQTQVFSNPNAAYLSGGASSIPSPLNIGLQNSRRFRALPVYALLLSEGRNGMAAMFARMVRLARSIAAFVRDSADYEWLPSEDASTAVTQIVVLFKAKDTQLNEELVERINETRRMYVSGTKWRGEKACRVAVSSWRVDVERDLAVVKEVLTAVAAGR